MACHYPLVPLHCSMYSLLACPLAPLHWLTDALMASRYEPDTHHMLTVPLFAPWRTARFPQTVVLVNPPPFLGKNGVSSGYAVPYSPTPPYRYTVPLRRCPHHQCQSPLLAAPHSAHLFPHARGSW